MSTPLAGVVKDVARLPREIIDAAVERFDEIALESAALVVGNGGVMQMHTARGRRSVPMRTKTTFRQRGVIIDAVVRGTPGGLWVWIEDGTSAHDIRPRRATRGRGKNKRRRAMFGPGLPHPVYVVHHRGSTGRHAWTRAVGDLNSEMGDVIDTQLREVFRG
jgi:hypothetical protein